MPKVATLGSLPDDLDQSESNTSIPIQRRLLDSDVTEDRNFHERIDERGAPSTSVTEAFELLSEPRRRVILEYLHGSGDDTVELDELATHVVDRERSNAATDRSTEERQRAYTDLYHAHVPRLCAADVTAYDDAGDTVRLETIPEPVERFLRLAAELEEADGER